MSRHFVSSKKRFNETLHFIKTHLFHTPCLAKISWVLSHDVYIHWYIYIVKDRLIPRKHLTFPKHISWSWSSVGVHMIIKMHKAKTSYRLNMVTVNIYIYAGQCHSSSANWFQTIYIYRWNWETMRPWLWGTSSSWVGRTSGPDQLKNQVGHPKPPWPPGWPPAAGHPDQKGWRRGRAKLLNAWHAVDFGHRCILSHTHIYIYICSLWGV